MDPVCPCGSHQAYAECCGRFHSGAATAPTAETLMRSRYSAYARRDADYLLRTWHPTTRPRRLEFEPDLRWTKLEVRFTTGGSLFDSEGTVLFEAHYTDRGRVGSMTENSQFTKVAGQWLYVGAITPSPSR